ncbi:MAG: Uma2 family endonuclease [bacterium]
MSTVERKPATIDDLYRVEGKAELVGGEIVHMSPSGFRHSRLIRVILDSLYQYECESRSGVALGDPCGFLCDLPNRQSFCPDVSYYTGPIPDDPDAFLPEPPTFAVEIRSANDYGPAAEKAMAEKRADYFAAGTRAVWDVDPDGPAIVGLYLHTQPENAIAFQKDDIAHAEPALPGWRFEMKLILNEMRPR